MARRAFSCGLLCVVALAGSPDIARATFSGQNGRIFYVAGAYTTSSEIRSVCADGTHSKQVTQLATLPSPSPDGKMIAFNKLTVEGGIARNDGIWIANADGSNPVEIASAALSPYSPTWSPDGTKLTFREYVYYEEIHTSVMQPVVADVSTKAVTPLLNDKNYSINSAQVAANAWSPDGSEIYFPGHSGSNGESVFRVAAGGGTPTKVLETSGELPSTQWLDISPDGSAMLEQHQATFEPDFVSEVWSYPLGAGTAAKVLESSASKGTGYTAASYSPDGKKIVFESAVGGQILTAATDGSNPVLLEGATGAYPRWSTNFDECTHPGAVIAGSVRDDRGLPAAGVTLTLTGKSDEEVEITTTVKSGGTGDYEFEVPAGNYAVTASGDISEQNGGALAVSDAPGGAHEPECPGTATNAKCTLSHLASGATAHPNFTYTYCASSEAHPNGKPPTGCPIIFIPGFLGSRIVCDDGELWTHIPAVDFADMRLQSDGVTNAGAPGSCSNTATPVLGQKGVVSTAAFKDVYGKALAFINRIEARGGTPAPEKGAYAFTYDWRKSPLITLSALNNEVDEVLSETGATRVVLMAHSMGGS